MKKQKIDTSKIPFGLIIFAGIAALMFVWSAYLGNTYKPYEGLAETPLIEKADLKNLQDGTYVSTYGKPELLESPVDPLTGVTDKNCVAVLRKVEMYQYYTYDDNLYKGFQDYQCQNIKGKNGEYYANPVFPSGIESAYFYGKVSINGIIIGENFLDEIITGYRLPTKPEGRVFSDIRSFDNKLGIYPTVDGYYASGDPDAESWEIGDIRITVTCVYADELENYLVMGTLRNGEIICTPEQDCFVSTEYPEPSSFTEDFIARQKSNERGVMIAGFVFIAIGVASFAVQIVSNKKSKKG